MILLTNDKNLAINGKNNLNHIQANAWVGYKQLLLVVISLEWVMRRLNKKKTPNSWSHLQFIGSRLWHLAFHIP